MKKIKLLGWCLCATMTAAVLSGCAGKDAAGGEGGGLARGEVQYPIQTDQTLTYWVRLPAALGTSVKNFGETPFAKAYMEKTGINVTYMHPAQGQEREVLNLLLASGDMPDIIETNWLERDPDSMIMKKTILKLNDIIDGYSPNLKKYLSENPDNDKAVRTDSGNYYVYPFIRGHEKLLSTAGLMVRADWLTELNLAAPETMDEWDQMLEKFKTKCESPLAMSATGGLNWFAGAYDLNTDFYIDGGKVKFGAAEPAFKDYLVKMNEWYQKGYIDKNFAILDSKLINSNMLEGKSGACFGAGGGQLGVYLSAKEKDADGYDLTAVQFPTLKKGEKPEFGNKQLSYSPLNGAAITAKSKNPELAARFLDYSYSQEGYMLNNFGIEGESYEMKDDYPTFTELITAGAEGKSMAQMLPLYVRSANEGPFVQDVRYIEQYYQLPQQKKALETWSYTNHDKHVLPQVTLTAEETTEFSKLMSEIRTYRDEAITNFILGSQPVDSFDKFVSDLKDMQLDRAIEIEQAAYDRFLNRK